MASLGSTQLDAAAVSCAPHAEIASDDKFSAAAGQKIPLEILPLGDFEPIYGSPLNVQAGELPVLPMSIYGAVAMAHAPDADEGFAAADEFFIYKFDKAASGLAGLSFDEGTFGVFGYISKVSSMRSAVLRNMPHV